MTDENKQKRIDWPDLAEHILKYKYVETLDCKQAYRLVEKILRELHDAYGWRTRDEVSVINGKLTRAQQELAAIKKLYGNNK